MISARRHCWLSAYSQYIFCITVLDIPGLLDRTAFGGFNLTERSLLASLPIRMAETSNAVVLSLSPCVNGQSVGRILLY